MKIDRKLACKVVLHNDTRCVNSTFKLLHSAALLWYPIGGNVLRLVRMCSITIHFFWKGERDV